jgi:hypothetical protein
MLRVSSVQFLPHVATLKVCFNDETAFEIRGALKGDKVCGLEDMKITRGSKLLAKHLGQQGKPPQIVAVEIDELPGLLPYLELAMQYIPTNYAAPGNCSDNEKEVAAALANLFHIHSKEAIEKLRKRLENNTESRKPDTS